MDTNLFEFLSISFAALVLNKSLFVLDPCATERSGVTSITLFFGFQEE